MIVLGADHHGYVGRMRAVAACFGDDPDQTLEILIGQLVNLVRNGQPARMSKRAGTIVTLADLTGAIGVDPARYALARYALDSAIDLDLDLWTRGGNDNPVYYVQYAHARIAAIRRAAAAAGVELGSGYDPQVLTHDREGDLLFALAQFPGVVASAADLRHPHRVARYLEELAGTYHRFHDACRILPRDGQPASPVNRARLWVAEATRIVLANGLQLLGVSPPDRLQPGATRHARHPVPWSSASGTSPQAYLRRPSLNIPDTPKQQARPAPGPVMLGRQSSSRHPMTTSP